MPLSLRSWVPHQEGNKARQTGKHVSVCLSVHCLCFPFVFCFLSCHVVLTGLILYSSGCLPTCGNPPVSASLVLKLQACATITPNKEKIFSVRTPLYKKKPWAAPSCEFSSRPYLDVERIHTSLTTLVASMSEKGGNCSFFYYSTCLQGLQSMCAKFIC